MTVSPAASATVSPPIPTHIIAEDLARFQVSPAAYIQHCRPDLDRLVVGAVVVHHDQMLLIQRSRHDWGGLCWEIPGGMCEEQDTSVLGAACRELEEEAGLRATAILKLVDEKPLKSSDDLSWGKVTFLVQVEQAADGAAAKPAVTLDPLEHEDYVWATEENLLAGSCGDRTFRWIDDSQRDTILKAFRIAKHSSKLAGKNGIMEDTA
ncbi:uncharacterized protein JN550_005849 [Neoarthrinium moseri]|uniref:uncharacterized protein n=1 Tax=Neoarthrinium moseri TaxID=1658444 RepID=UPI001FDC18B0|nr:uncharacterized protein JN550_005849 [Neoarthrinium moseri]KAI1869219.1 hypothetical protein JN550_005849 [Neoarthrinium moseri]